jgi:hypothetical protein
MRIAISNQDNLAALFIASLAYPRSRREEKEREREEESQTSVKYIRLRFVSDLFSCWRNSLWTVSDLLRSKQCKYGMAEMDVCLSVSGCKSTSCEKVSRIQHVTG